jgi:hypothetical protein
LTGELFAHSVEAYGQLVDFRWQGAELLGQRCRPCFDAPEIVVNRCHARFDTEELGVEDAENLLDYFDVVREAPGVGWACSRGPPVVLQSPYAGRRIAPTSVESFNAASAAAARRSCDLDQRGAAGDKTEEEDMRRCLGQLLLPADAGGGGAGVLEDAEAQENGAEAIRSALMLCSTSW